VIKAVVEAVYGQKVRSRACPRASFTESLPAVRARSRLTTRLRAELGCAVAEQQRCVSEAAAHYGASWPIVHSLLGLAGTNPERHVIRTRLDSFYQQAAATDAPEAHRLAATIEAWWPAIEAGLLTGYSNSRSEGYNRLAKRFWVQEPGQPTLADTA
jgi:hypothetical protein